MDKNKKIKILELIIILLVFVIYSSSTGTILAGHINVIDEGQYAAWLQHMMSGEKMYKDIYITYGPLHIYPLFLISKVIDPSIWLIRFFIALGGAFGVVMALKIMQELGVVRWLRYVSTIFLILLPIFQLRQSIGFVCLYILLLIINKYTNKRILLLGVFNMISFLISPDIGAITIFLSLLYFLTEVFILSNKNLYKRILYFISGIFIVLIPFLLWSAWEGWLVSYTLTTIDVLSSFSGVNLPNGKNFSSPQIFYPSGITSWLKSVLSKDAILYYILLIYTGSFLFCIYNFIEGKQNKTKQLFFLTFYGFLLYQVVISRSGVGHMFFTFSAVFIILVYYLDYLIKKIKSNTNNTIYIIAACFILLILLRVIRINVPSTERNLENILRQKNINASEKIGYLSLDKNQDIYFSELQKYFKNENTKQLKIFILSNEPALYFLLNADNPTRYDLPYIATTKEKRYEILSGLMQNIPDYIIYNTADWQVDEVSNRRRLPEIVQFINHNYRKDALIQKTLIYKKNEK